MVRIFAKKRGEIARKNVWKPMEMYAFAQRKPWAFQRAKKCETDRPQKSPKSMLPLPPKKWGSQGIRNHQSSPGEGGIRGAPLDFPDLIRSPKKQNLPG